MGAGNSTPYQFPGFCVVVANSAFFAAGTPAAPAASVTDGLLDVITVRDGTKLSFARVMLRALPSVLQILTPPGTSPRPAGS